MEFDLGEYSYDDSKIFITLYIDRYRDIILKTTFKHPPRLYIVIFSFSFSLSWIKLNGVKYIIQQCVAKNLKDLNKFEKFVRTNSSSDSIFTNTNFEQLLYKPHGLCI